jgi:glucose-6-phosphate 1-dehydrogenase
MTVSMDYCQSCNIFYRSPEAYERLLQDIMTGDATLFTRWDEVYSAWQLVSEFTEKTADKDIHMTTYVKGSSGPVEADELLARDGRKWWHLDDLKSDFMLGG